MAGPAGGGAISGPVKALARHEETGSVFFSDGARVFVKKDDCTDIGELPVTAGVPGLIQIDALHAVGRWVLAAYSSPLPAGSFPHPTAVPVGLVTAWDYAAVLRGEPIKSILLQPSPTEVAAHKLGATAIESVALPGEEPYIFTGSMDGTIKMWQFSAASGAFSCKPFDSANAHVRGVRSLVFINGHLFSASGDRTVKVWDPATLTCVATVMPPAPASDPATILAKTSVRGGGGGGAGASAAAAAVRAAHAGVNPQTSVEQDVVAIDAFVFQNQPIVVAAYKDGSIRCYDVSVPATPKVIDQAKVDGGGQGNDDTGKPLELCAMVHMPLDAAASVEPALLIAYHVSLLGMKEIIIIISG